MATKITSRPAHTTAIGPRISIVIPTYNKAMLLDECLASIGCQTRKPYEVIVVDNGSSDGTAALVRKRHPHVRIVRSERNLGFAGGMNLGMRAARGTHLFLLNNDTRLSPGCVAGVVAAVKDADPRTGMWSLKLVLPTGAIDTIGIMINPLGLSKDVKEESRAAVMTGPCGGAAVFSKECLDDIAEKGEWFDSRLFAYNEDADLAWRAALRGWRNEYIPCVVHHHHGATTAGKDGQVRDPFVYLSLRNRIIVFLKNRTWLAVFIIPFILMQTAILSKYALHGKGRLAFRATIDGFRCRIRDPDEIMRTYGPAKHI